MADFSEFATDTHTSQLEEEEIHHTAIPTSLRTLPGWPARFLFLDNHSRRTDKPFGDWFGTAKNFQAMGGRMCLLMVAAAAGWILW